MENGRLKGMCYFNNTCFLCGYLQLHKTVQEDKLEGSQELVSTDPQRLIVSSQSNSTCDPP